jgi:hypothetical protein
MFKIGDYVRIKQEIPADSRSSNRIYFNNRMAKLCGQEYAISEITSSALNSAVYKLTLGPEETYWEWSEEWLELVTPLPEIPVDKRLLSKINKYINQIGRR